jgi:hypothetical protein
MNGKLGSIHIGREQIGGFLDWDVDIILNDIPKGEVSFYKLNKWVLKARSYWLFDIPNKVTVRLYMGKGYFEGVGFITHVDKIFDTLIHKEIEIIGEGILEGKS